MTLDTVHGLPQFLRHLSAIPSPQDVLTALHHGPLGGYGVRSSLMWHVRGDELVALASVGHTREEFAQYATLPLSLDLSVVRAVRTNTVLVDVDAFAPARPARDMRDGEFRDALLRRGDAASAVRVPLVHGGRAVGAIGLVTDKPWPDDDATVALVECISLAMGLWLTNPRSGVSSAAEQPVAREWSLSFTERERAILRLVEQGRSNPAIAKELHLSASTVKQDLRRCMRALRSDDRLAAASRARALGLM